MSVHLRSTHVKAGRKVYSCAWCDEAIEVGEAHWYHVGTWDGDFTTCRHHAECERAWERWCRENPWDEYQSGEMSRGNPWHRYDDPPKEEG